ncbi:MAG TPA: ImmA/IrrE family metallo-endopeptidase [Candidatus Atribacteria bacterium]|nr:ImmA/IrrE family metallo-endopeptidase [Candidatus Atribacteria bacterium]
MRRIIEKADEIRKKYGLDDLCFVAEKLGAKVVEHALGRVIKEAYFKDLGVIVVDPSLHPYKKRHLIAHGLAHHLFHRKRKVNYFLDQGKCFLKNLDVIEQEREAEVFAAYLLIPEGKLKAILNEDWVKDSLDPIPELAEEFQVSEHFMKKRLEVERLLR